MNKVSDSLKNDPSEIKQEFSNINIKLLCCRYWILQEWQCSDLSVPFWRIYHNNIGDAKIHFNGRYTSLNKQTIVIIPPHTAFSTTIGNFGRNHQQESIVGRKFERRDDIHTLTDYHRVDHLFIHFSLGFPLDFVQTGIYTISCNSTLQALIEDIQISCIDDTHFNLLECLRIKQLINSCLLNIRENIWKVDTVDPRIFIAMKTIERNFNQGISNADLANTANMAVNSFSRLFKTCTGFSVQQYIAKTKIEVACNLMHHSSKTIDEIAYTCGFYDRHHFSKIFKRQMKVNPSYYMKNLIIS
ncbi:helix-turn-helix domain-containing protein [Pedobacter xixiisoli]|nr:AraC family transcriptional regulator [Pedobacter xixiisoli]